MSSVTLRGAQEEFLATCEIHIEILEDLEGGWKCVEWLWFCRLVAGPLFAAAGRSNEFNIIRALINQKKASHTSQQANLAMQLVFFKGFLKEALIGYIIF